jgi:periplasmic divalent cation tolerance protein
MRDAIQIVTTTDSRPVAEHIARVLVEQRLAACVQIGGPVTSVYRWQGEIECAEEWVCTIKTTVDRYPDVECQIRALHTYEEPEILQLPLSGGSDAYLTWLRQQVDASATSAQEGGD